MELLLFYKVSFIVAALSSSALSLIGRHHLSRSKVLEIFCLSQFALVGNLASRLVFHHHDGFEILISYIFFGLGKLLIDRVGIKKVILGPSMVGVYLFLMAIQHLLTGLFPQLDSHMSVGFFGNMVTASATENNTMVAIFFLFLLIFSWKKNQIKKNTLEINILKGNDNSVFELLLFSIPLVISLYGLGFLYTLSYLLLPALLIGASFKNEKGAGIAILTVSVLSAVSGLFLSISVERVSTTPTQVVLLFFGLIIINSAQKVLKKVT